MARAAEGWQLFRAPHTGVYQVRFTYRGRRRVFTTRERDPGPAAEAAARIYAEVVSDRWAPGRTVVVQPGRPFDEVAAQWLADLEPTVDRKTFTVYRDTYVAKHFVPFFRTIDALTTVRAEEYVAARLREVTRQTVIKEISLLRRLAKWAQRRGYLERTPEIEPPGARVVGTTVTNARKQRFLIFTAQEIESIIAALPECATVNRTGEKLAVRARFVVAWETSLRPATLDKLSVPENYRAGSSSLTITDCIDKNRFRRDLPLSEAARKALDAVCPASGLIFGAHDYRAPLRLAAKAAGIDAYRADRISPYDLRHSRLTHLGQVTSNLSGIMFLAGHRQPSTTAKYLRPQRAAAEDVLAAVADSRSREFWLHTGYAKPDEGSGNAKPDKRVEESRENAAVSDPVPVELMGIEPTASRVRF